MNYKQKTAENITYQVLSIYCATLHLLDFAVSGYTYIICIKNRELLAILNGAFAIATHQQLKHIILIELLPMFTFFSAEIKTLKLKKYKGCPKFKFFTQHNTST